MWQKEGFIVGCICHANSLQRDTIRYNCFHAASIGLGGWKTMIIRQLLSTCPLSTCPLSTCFIGRYFKWSYYSQLCGSWIFFFGRYFPHSTRTTTLLCIQLSRQQLKWQCEQCIIACVKINMTISRKHSSPSRKCP